MFFGLCLWLSFAATLPASRPVAVVDGSAYDMPRFTRRVMAPSGYAWEECGKFLDPARFKDYSIVVWFHGCAEPLNERQIADTVKYLRSGGRILHTASGLYARQLGGNLKKHGWTGVKSWNYVGKPPRPHFPFLELNHPYLAGIDTDRDYAWQNAHYNLTIDPEATVNIIGSEKNSILASTAVGKGEVVWLWEGPFRGNSAERPGDAEVFDRLLLNIIAAADPLTNSELIEREVPAFGRDRAALVCWKRDWDYSARQDHVFLRPYPLPGELISGLSFHSAVNERDTQFVLCQSLVNQRVAAELAPLVGGGREHPGHIGLYVSGNPPTVPSLVKEGQEGLPGRQGRFMQLPVTNGLAIDNWRPRVLWLRLDTSGLEPGQYSSALKLKGESTEIELPVEVTVYPVRIPRKPIAELLYWGAVFPNREPFFSERIRQNCTQLSLMYPSLTGIVVRATGETLREARSGKSGIFAGEDFPALDFRGAYERDIMEALEAGLTYVRVHDTRTGGYVAEAGSGEKLGDKPPRLWSSRVRELYTGYYRALYEYLGERGFEEVDMMHSDEPSWGSIQSNYLPRAKLYMDGGMGTGAHWTAGGFQSPEQVNTFAPYTTDWSMYTIMIPNFLRFLREGSVTLHPRSKVGLTRGGSGLALRNPFNRLRTYAWELVYYGEPLNFLRTGPVWKEWLYYYDYGIGAKKRPDGVEGERLLAYGSPDRFDGSAPMLSSSDWESGREGIDDVNLVRMLQWYLKKIEDGRSSSPEARGAVKAIRDDMAGWFRDSGGESVASTVFDQSGRLLADEGDGSAAPSSDTAFDGFKIKHRTHGQGEGQYKYQSLEPPSTAQLEDLKRIVLSHLMALRPYVVGLGGTLTWHGWKLVSDGRPRSRLVVSDDATPAILEAVGAFREKCAELAGRAPEVALASRRRGDERLVDIRVGLATDSDIAAELSARGWAVDEDYPGAGSYVIKRLHDKNTLMVVGVDEAGLSLGLRNFAVFLDGRGNWIF